MSDELQIDFGAITGGVAPTEGKADQMLSQAAADIAAGKEVLPKSATAIGVNRDASLPGQEPGEFSCMKMLTPTQQEQAKKAGAELFARMVHNTDVLSEFGNQALDAVNMQVNRIFREIGPVEIPELTKLMEQINDQMREFRRNYDPTVPKVRDAFQRFSDSVKGVFQRGRDVVEMLFEQAQSVEKQLDRVAGQLIDKQRELRRNVVLCDELYRANEVAISQLVGTIAVMEAIRDQALAAITSIEISPDDPDKRSKEEQRAQLADFLSALEVRINEFQQRLFVAWSTSPQVRNTRSLHYGLGQRLALMVNLTIPTMKLTIAQWGLMMQAQQAAEMQQAVAQGANEVLQAYAQASGRATADISHAIQTPTLDPETILEVAVSLDNQADAMIEAVKYGQQARSEVVSALLTAQSAMSQTSDRLSQTVVELVTKADQQPELPPVPTLPNAVLANAEQMAQPAVETPRA